jgi:hypothetical protein
MISPVYPKWRTLLNWGAVIYFLLIPALVIIYSLFGLKPVDPSRAAFVISFHYGVSAIVATLAGLNSWDKHTIVKNGDSKTPK